MSHPLSSLALSLACLAATLTTALGTQSMAAPALGIAPAVAPTPDQVVTDRVGLRFDDYPPDHIFNGDTIDLPTRIVNQTTQPLTCIVRTTLAEYRPNEDGKTLASTEQTLTLQPGQNAKAPATFNPPTPLAPGPYEFRIAIEIDGKLEKQVESTLLYKPAEWKLPDLEPADFDAFWQSTLQEQSKRPLEPKISDPVTRKLIPEPFMEVSFNGLGERRIRGYLGIPPQLKQGEKAPAILALPSASYHSAAVEAAALKAGYIFLAISIHDMPFGGESGRTHPKEYWFDEPYQGIGRQSKETFYYRAAYAAGPRAVEYLRSLPQVDAEKIVILGMSQGGSLALATAALVPDVALLEITIPGRSRMDLLTHTYKANMSLEPPVGMTADEMLKRTLLYYDVSYFAKRVRCPALVGASLDDPVNPGPLQYWAYRSLTQSPDARLHMVPWRKHQSPPDPEHLSATMRSKYAPATGSPVEK